jgi:hypothetical protein
MDRIVDFKKSVFELCQADPAVIEIMKGLGFESIANPAMLKTAGRFMNIPKGAQMKGIPMEKVKETFRQNGYSIVE